jgi:hypothetical protein
MAACNPAAGWCCGQGYMPSRCQCAAWCFACLGEEAFLDSFTRWSLPMVASELPPNENRLILSSQHRRWPNVPSWSKLHPALTPMFSKFGSSGHDLPICAWGGFTDSDPRRSTRLNGRPRSKVSRHEVGSRLEAGLEGKCADYDPGFPFD